MPHPASAVVEEGGCKVAHDRAVGNGLRGAHGQPGMTGHVVKTDIDNVLGGFVPFGAPESGQRHSAHRVVSGFTDILIGVANPFDLQRLVVVDRFGDPFVRSGECFRQ